MIPRTRPLALLAPLALALLAPPGARPAAPPRPRTDRYGDPLPPGAVARLGTVRLRHPGGISGLAFAAGGKVLASCDEDGVIRFWEVATGKQARRLEGHRGTVVFGLGGARPVFAAAGAEGAVVLRDAATGKEVRRVGKRGEGYLAFPQAFSPDGKALAVLSDEAGYGYFRQPRYRVRLWEVRTGRMLRELAWAGGCWEDPQVGFSPGGTELALVTRATPWGEARVTLWDVATGKRVPLPSRAPLGGAFAAFTPDGRMLAVAADTDGLGDQEPPGGPDHGLDLWELDTGEVALRVDCPAAAVCCRVSVDGRLLAWGDRAGSVGVADLFTGRLLRRSAGHRGAVLSLAFSPGGRVLASGGADGTALLWDLSGCRPGRAAGLAPRDLRPLWESLAGRDAKEAHRAVGALSGNPRLAVPFLAARLRPVPRPHPARVRRLLTDLDSDSYAARGEAMAELESLERAAVPLLREALAGRPPLEVHRRVRQLLATADAPARSPERLRARRAVRCLESSAGPEALRVLKQLATGAPEARLTQEAKAALRRLEGRAGGKR